MLRLGSRTNSEYGMEMEFSKGRSIVPVKILYQRCFRAEITGLYALLVKVEAGKVRLYKIFID